VIMVASHVGAWIETDHCRTHYRLDIVASHVGAWIETQTTAQPTSDLSVASHVGAWIETQMAICEVLKNASHPMWVRGLKR